MHHKENLKQCVPSAFPSCGGRTGAAGSGAAAGSSHGGVGVNAAVVGLVAAVTAIKAEVLCILVVFAVAQREGLRPAGNCLTAEHFLDNVEDITPVRTSSARETRCHDGVSDRIIGDGRRCDGVSARTGSLGKSNAQWGAQ